MDKSLKNKRVEEVEIQSTIVDKKAIFRPDFKQRATLIKAGRNATTKAVRVSKALGLSITFMENGIMYKEFPNGDKEVVKPKSKRVVQRLKKGLILHVK